MDDPLLLRRFERLRDLLRDRQRVVDRDRPTRDSLREVFALDQFHHESMGTVGLIQDLLRAEAGARRENLSNL